MILLVFEFRVKPGGNGEGPSAFINGYGEPVAEFRFPADVKDIDETI